MPRPWGPTTLRILKALRSGRRYGLDIMQATGLASGTVYPGLARLEKWGLVSAAWESGQIAEREGRPRRRYYRITPEGQAALELGLERLRSLVEEPPPEADSGASGLEGA